MPKKLTVMVQNGNSWRFMRFDLDKMESDSGNYIIGEDDLGWNVYAMIEE